jgi:hypothetical protein
MLDCVAGKSVDKAHCNPIEEQRCVDRPLRAKSRRKGILLTGTIVNSGAILAGALVGLRAGKHLPERLKTTVMQGLGLSVILIGLQMALSGKEPLAAIGCRAP